MNPPSKTPETDAEIERMQARGCRGDVNGSFASKLEIERDEARAALADIGDIFHVMRPRYSSHPTMDGRYPCWIVWLPNEGTCERKSLSAAILEYIQQTKSPT